ncbi:Uncharacterised protein [Serratia rubidaea]|nr:Uncharacterised protein [Serratia rubidaea]
MQQKNGQAEIHIGNQVIRIPVHEELVIQLLKSENSLKLDSMEMTRFLKGYLSTRTREVSLRVKDIELDFTVPAWLADTLEFEISSFIPEQEYSDDFGQIIRKMIPSDIRPPTEKQLSYAKRIAVTLGKELTDEQISSVSKCSDFIDKHLPAFYEMRAKLNSLYVMSRKAARGYVVLCLASGYGGITDELLDVMGVSRKTTVEKYLEQFRSYLDEFHNMEPQNQQISIGVVNEFVQENYDKMELPELDVKAIERLLVDTQAKGGV